MKNIIVGFILLCGCIPAFAQADRSFAKNDTIRWTASEFFNKETLETSVGNSTFIINGEQTIVWAQPGSETVYEFEIIKRTGTWTNLDNDGELSFTVARKGKPGKLIFSRAGESVKVAMEFLREGVNAMPFTFTVTRIEKL